MQEKKSYDQLKNQYRTQVYKKIQEEEDGRKKELNNKLATEDQTVQAYKDKIKTDQRLRIEYERLRRREKEDSVKRS